MHKTAAKNFAVRARAQLIEAAKRRAQDFCPDETAADPSAAAAGVSDRCSAEQIQALRERIAALGIDRVAEEAAFVWFSRFIALRYMEANGLLPSGRRIFTDASGAFRPELPAAGEDCETYFRRGLLELCAALGDAFPGLFGPDTDWAEALLPADLTRPGGVIAQLVTAVPEEEWRDRVQTVGRLFQYYNTEPKDEAFALLKKNVKLTKERVPAAMEYGECIPLEEVEPC